MEEEKKRPPDLEDFLWRNTKEDGNIPVHNFRLIDFEKDKSKLKNFESLDNMKKQKFITNEIIKNKSGIFENKSIVFCKNLNFYIQIKSFNKE